jgi:hypothetical protein
MKGFTAKIAKKNPKSARQTKGSAAGRCLSLEANG